MKSFNQSYSNKDITVFFKPRLCTHAGVCITELPEVFNLYQEPWVNVNVASTKKIIACVDRCPTGALSYEWINKKIENKSKSEETLITLIKKGPLIIHNDCKIIDENMKEHIVKGKASICMCGLSEKYPFCDGKHTNLTK